MEGSVHTAERKTKFRAHEKHNDGRIRKWLRGVIIDATVTFVVMGFLIGRVAVLDKLSPFGIAFLVSVMMASDIKKTAYTGIGIIAGILTKFYGLQAVQAIAAVMTAFLAIKFLRVDSKTPTIKAASITFGVNFIVSLIFNPIINGKFILNDTLIGLFNAVISMVLVYIYNYFLPVITTRRRNLLSDEEIICIFIVCGILVSSFSDVYIYGISVKVVFTILIVLLTAYIHGSAAAASIGMTIGLISCMSQSNVPVIAGVFGLCGIFAGIFKGMKKIGTAFGFIAGDIAVYFYQGGLNAVISFRELTVGVGLFIVFPMTLIERILPLTDFKAKNYIEQQSYAARVKDILCTRVSHTMEVFKELSKTLQECESKDVLRKNGDINGIISSVTDRVCAECDVRNVCWSRDFYCTYQNMFDMVDTVQADGSISMDTLPADMKKKCIKASQMVKTINYVFDIYRMNYKWRKKAQESKKVVGEQLEGVNDILKKLSDSLKTEVNFKSDIEEEVAVALDKEGIEFNDVAAVKSMYGRYEVNIYRKSCAGKRVCIKDIEPVVSKVLQKKMERDRAYCRIKEDTNICCFKLIESVKFRITTGIAREVKDKGGISGDNYSFLELSSGQQMMVLSDGMGTGPAAAAESSTAVNLLEKYLEAGFDRKLAIKAINSVMVLNSPDDDYATIDLAIVDLYTGEAEFVKIGAASTFIKRMDGSIDAINSSTLPMGILNEVDMEYKSTKLNHGDLLIMLTDGIQDSGRTGEHEWITGALEEIKSRNPQQVADELLQRAKQRNDGKIEDDMTVMVSKIWEIL